MWTVEGKARVLAYACQLNGEEQQIAYLERERVKRAEYEQWRLALDGANRDAEQFTDRFLNVALFCAYSVIVRTRATGRT
jgi:hypothetical protein